MPANVELSMHFYPIKYSPSHRCIFSNQIFIFPPPNSKEPYTSRREKHLKIYPKNRPPILIFPANGIKERIYLYGVQYLFSVTVTWLT